MKIPHEVELQMCSQNISERRLFSPKNLIYKQLNQKKHSYQPGNPDSPLELISYVAKSTCPITTASSIWLVSSL